MKVDDSAIGRPRSSATAYEGIHVLLDLFGVERLDDPIFLEAVLMEVAQVSGAHIIGSNFHHFGPGQGVTGVLLLAESHISIHSWPERKFAAVDLFLCGQTNRVDAAVFRLRCLLRPSSISEKHISRG